MSFTQGLEATQVTLGEAFIIVFGSKRRALVGGWVMVSGFTFGKIGGSQLQPPIE